MTKSRIENIVASTRFADSPDLCAISLALEGTEYEPELFPGMAYRVSDPKVVILLFNSGKVVLTGARRAEDLERAI